MIKVDNRSEYLPTCMHYADYLSEAVLIFRITREDARERFGKYTYRQWNDLFFKNNKEHLNVSKSKFA